MTADELREAIKTPDGMQLVRSVLYQCGYLCISKRAAWEEMPCSECVDRARRRTRNRDSGRKDWMR